MVLTRDAIRAKHSKIPTREVYIPDWGGTVIVRGMRGRERDDLEMRAALARRGEKDPQKNTDNLRAVLAVTCCQDESGKPIFTAADEMDLGLGGCRALEVIYDTIMELSGIGAAAQAELEKNSASAQNAATGTATPSSSVAP